VNDDLNRTMLLSSQWSPENKLTDLKHKQEKMEREDSYIFLAVRFCCQYKLTWSKGRRTGSILAL